MEGLSLGSALRIDPRVATLAAAALLLATLTGFALAAPLVLLFSPVLVPAALAVAGLAAAGALAVSGASALVRVVGYV
uniref:Oleosin n=1 Tax=Aegilops tauschii subsp. strangulata TaxID=200361 RepID=A0A452YNZ9_AEGTS